MKNILVSSVMTLVILFCGSVFADSVVVTDTAGYTAVPIVVDETADTYTVTGSATVPAKNYYYTYPGYRCFSEKRDFVGINAVVFKAGVSGGSDIYCYKE